MYIRERFFNAFLQCYCLLKKRKRLSKVYDPNVSEGFFCDRIDELYAILVEIVFYVVEYLAFIYL